MMKESEFQIDLDFKNQTESVLSGDGLDLDNDDDSGDEDIFKNIEKITDEMMLSSPEYFSFDQLAEKMIDCVPSGAVKMLILEEGKGPLVPVDAEVTIHYAAYWEKASIPFDSTLTMNRGNPMIIRLGVGRLIPGLEIGLTMVRGPTARLHLLIQPEMAWGQLGVQPRVKPEPALFVLHLTSVTHVGAQHRFNDLPTEEQMKFEVTEKTVTSLHVQAKDFFAKKKYSKAIKNYQQSLSVLVISKPSNDQEISAVKQFKINSYINLAVCYYKVNNPKYLMLMLKTMDDYTDSIENHCKALFYYGRAQEMVGKIDEAIKYYKKALKMEPKNKDIGKALTDLDSYIRKSAEKEKEMWQSAFKASPKKKENIVYDVNEDFKDGVRDMCQDLAGRSGFARFDLPTGLTKDEVNCIKSLIGDFEGLNLIEDGEGSRKKLSIVKKMLV